MSDRMIRLRCSNRDFENWKSKADSEGFRELSSWIRGRLNAEDRVATQVLAAVPLASPGLPVPGVRVGSPPGVATEGQDSVESIVFEKPATWKLATVGGLRTSVSKKPDPSSKKWAKQDLMTFCVENDVLGFQRAWDDLESRLSGDGEFSV